MSASARYVVYSYISEDQRASPVLRNGTCPVGEEYLQVNNEDEDYYTEAEIANILLSLGGESINDAQHFMEWVLVLPPPNPPANTYALEVELRAPMQIAQVFTYINHVTLGERETAIFEEIPTGSSSPPVDDFVVATVRTTAGVFVTEELVGNYWQYQFAAGQVYDVTFTGFPSYFPVTFRVGSPLNGPFYTARGYGQVGKIKTTVSVTLPSVAATGSPGTLQRLILADITGVAATGQPGVAGFSITPADAIVVGVEAIGLAISNDDLGSLGTTFGGEISGVAAAGAVGVVEKTHFAYITGVVGTTEENGAGLYPYEGEGA